MSRILRRPMFRKGGLSSEDTGIVSGLGYRHRQGYAGGADSQGVQQNIIDTLNTAGIEASNLPNIMPPEIRAKDLINTLKYKTGINEVNTTSDFDVMPAPRGVPFISATPQSEYNQKKAQLDILSQPEMIDKLKKEYEQQDLSQISKINPTNLISYINRQTPGTQQYLNSLVEKLPEQYKLNKQQQQLNQQSKKEDSFSETNLGNEAQSFLKQLKDLGIGPDQDALTRQRYLELAKFGFNLASQPTPVGYKPNLLNSIARAAEPVVPGLEKIEQQQQEQNQALKNAAVTLASKKIFPTSSAGETLAYLQSKGIKTPDAVNLIFGKAEQQQLNQQLNYYQSAFGKKIDKNILNSVAQNAAIYTTKTGNPISVSDLQPFKPNSSVNNAQAGKYYYDENNGSIYLGNANGTYTSVTQPR